MEQPQLIPHLFRTEYRKIVSVLCKTFGFDHIEIAEDIASDTFLSASELWGLKGLPENPTAWLYSVAKNKALNHLQKKNVFINKITPEIKNYSDILYEHQIDLSPQNINDSQLQMMFAICHPSISAEAQIGLSLRILCGFGIEEIADAFLSTKETINKRLFRAKEKLRIEKVKIELPDTSKINERLEPVLTTLYLLFNEGYHSTSKNTTLRKDLCLEAIRLTYLLAENNDTNKPIVNALLSLMCFHASRFEARIDKNGEIILYEDQDITLWNAELISKGELFLNRAAKGEFISKYHLEAAIAYWHTIKADTMEKWENILQLYNKLLLVEYSPIAALNRTYALSKTNGNAEAIAEAEKLKLTENHFYYVLLGELYKTTDIEKAKMNFENAYALARTQTEKQLIRMKIDNM